MNVSTVTVMNVAIKTALSLRHNADLWSQQTTHNGLETGVLISALILTSYRSFMSSKVNIKKALLICLLKLLFG